jgi:hypothetical protein
MFYFYELMYSLSFCYQSCGIPNVATVHIQERSTSADSLRICPSANWSCQEHSTEHRNNV